MIRVKIRLSNKNAEGKILRFNRDTTDFDTLLTKIASKLGVARAPALSLAPTNNVCTSDDDAQLSSSLPSSDTSLNLYLGGDIMVEDTHEIDEGDDLVLRFKKRSVDVDHQLDGEVGVGVGGDDNEAGLKATMDSNGDNNEDGNRSDDDDGSLISSRSCIEDVTDHFMDERKRRRKGIESIDLVSFGDSDCGDDGSEGNTDDELYIAESENEDKDETYEEEEEQKPTSKKRKRKTPNPVPPESPLKVLMNEKDMPTAPGRPIPTSREEGYPDSASFKESSTMCREKTSPDTNTDQNVKDRIIKLLNTGFHDKSNEYEAKNAIKLAQRLMNKHNLSQAILLQERDDKNNSTTADDNGEILKGGMVEIRITNRKTSKPALLARWINQLLPTISKNFGVENFFQSMRGLKCSVTFYGIYTNCQLAAYAFRVAVERIAQMTMSYAPVKSGRSVSLKSARLSYALGIVKGITKEVKATLQRDKKMREEKLEQARNAVARGVAYEESGDDDDDDIGVGYSFPSETGGVDDFVNNTSRCDGTGNLNLELPAGSSQAEKNPDDKSCSNHHVQTSQVSTLKTTTSSSATNPTNIKLYKGERLGHRLKEMQQEEQAALVLVDHRKKVAKQILEENKIKLTTAARRQPILFDRLSYKKGIEDSKEIDINQRAIRDNNAVAKKERL